MTVVEVATVLVIMLVVVAVWWGALLLLGAGAWLLGQILRPVMWLLDWPDRRRGPRVPPAG